MNNITLVMLGAGYSSRFNLPVKKQWLRVGNLPLWQYCVNRLSKYYNFSNIIIVASSEDINYMKRFANYTFVKGGETRQESLKNALKLTKTKYVLVSDIARPCIPKKMFFRILESIKHADCVVPALKVSDTVNYVHDTVDREKIKLIQTPQLSKTTVLKNALNTNIEFTDDSGAIKANGGVIWYVQGDTKAHKITFVEDLKKIKKLKSPSFESFTGNGFDIHQFENGKKMILGGIVVHPTIGLKAHSDGDAVFHALIDAMLGASGLGDIGELFPDNDTLYKDIDSSILLQKTHEKIKKFGFDIINCDITIVAQIPKISPFKEEIEKNIACLLNISHSRVNIKATTAEHLGFIGKKEGLAVIANINLKFYDWKK